MNLYEFEGKRLLENFGVRVPKSFLLRKDDDYLNAYKESGLSDVVLKVQVLSGKRGKSGGIIFASDESTFLEGVERLFEMKIGNQPVVAVLVEEKIDIKKEHYISLVYDTLKKIPQVIYSKEGGMEIEDVDDSLIEKIDLDFKKEQSLELPFFDELWRLFKEQDLRQLEINPLCELSDGTFVAADAKLITDDDAFYRHDDWNDLEPRTMMGRPPTEREIMAKKIDEGENYYQGTASKYIEMDGDIAVLFSGGGASISGMDSLLSEGLKPSNYTEYSGNPPREKVYELTKVVLSKPGLKGLLIAGGVANFTNVKETFNGIVDALDEIKPAFPIMVRRSGPFENEGMQLMKECAERNSLNMKRYGKEVSISYAVNELSRMINE